MPLVVGLYLKAVTGDGRSGEVSQLRETTLKGKLETLENNAGSTNNLQVWVLKRLCLLVFSMSESSQSPVKEAFYPDLAKEATLSSFCEEHQAY